MPITATFPAITFPHRGVQTKDDFVLAQETAQDLLSGSLTTALNTFKTEANALETNVNAKEVSAVAAAAAAVAASNFQGTWTNQLTAVGQSWEYSGVIYGVLVAGTASPVTTPANWFALTIAQSIKNTPAGGISATTVQAALNELDTEKAAIASPTFTGTVTAPTLNVTTVNASASIIFEGATPDAFETILTVTDPTADRTVTFKDESGTVALLSDIAAIPSVVTGVRQTVQSGSVDASGLANFLSIGTGLNVNIAATTTPIKVHAAGGAISEDRLGTISADTTLLLPANTTRYIYVSVATDGTCTLGSTSTAPVYQFGGTPSITANHFTHNISEGKGYYGNGTTAPQVYYVFIGEAVVGASTVTSVVTYALNGMYDSGLTTNLPGASAQVSKNHNLGCQPQEAKLMVKNRVTQGGFPVGIELFNLDTRDTAGIAVSICPACTKLAVTIATSNNNAFMTTPYAGGLNIELTSTSWDYKLLVNRGW